MGPVRLLTALCCFILLLSAGCDDGLAPFDESQPSGFSGIIRFKNWPPPDSVQELRVVAFFELPTDSAGLLNVLLAGGAAVYPPVGTKGLTQYVDSLPYTFTNIESSPSLQVAVYKYVVIAQKYGSNIFTDWKPAGVYTLTPGTFEPAPVRVLFHRVIAGIDFDVDFHNPPPKPWK
jgi:hypothetical protein